VENEVGGAFWLENDGGSLFAKSEGREFAPSFLNFRSFGLFHLVLDKCPSMLGSLNPILKHSDLTTPFGIVFDFLCIRQLSLKCL
jgi:hypothetical protein